MSLMTIDQALDLTDRLFAQTVEWAGYTDAEIKQASDALGVSLPLELRQLYAHQGRCDVHRAHLKIRHPSKIELDGAFAVFYDDPASGASWAVSVADDARPCPVYCRIDGAWYEIEFSSVGEFLLFACVWQACEGAMPFSATVIDGVGREWAEHEVAKVVASCDDLGIVKVVVGEPGTLWVGRGVFLLHESFCRFSTGTTLLGAFERVLAALPDVVWDFVSTRDGFP